MNKFDFNNRTAVITGGGQGFGLDIAKRFLNSGAKVIIWDIDLEMIEKSTKDDSFFRAGHKIVLSNNLEINSNESYRQNIISS